jgi:hypothetical protein
LLRFFLNKHSQNKKKLEDFLKVFSKNLSAEKRRKREAPIVLHTQELCTYGVRCVLGFSRETFFVFPNIGQVCVLKTTY